MQIKPRKEFEQTRFDLIEESLLNTCDYCGHRGLDVNHVSYRYIGGQGKVSFPVCNDVAACIKRVEGVCNGELIRATV